MPSNQPIDIQETVICLSVSQGNQTLPISVWLVRNYENIDFLNILAFDELSVGKNLMYNLDAQTVTCPKALQAMAVAQMKLQLHAFILSKQGSE